MSSVALKKPRYGSFLRLLSFVFWAVAGAGPAVGAGAEVGLALTGRQRIVCTPMYHPSRQLQTADVQELSPVQRGLRVLIVGFRPLVDFGRPCHAYHTNYVHQTTSAGAEHSAQRVR
jgi:hypothetical protein